MCRVPETGPGVTAGTHPASGQPLRGGGDQDPGVAVLSIVGAGDHVDIDARTVEAVGEQRVDEIVRGEVGARKHPLADLVGLASVQRMQNQQAAFVQSRQHVRHAPMPDALVARDRVQTES